MHTHAVIEAFMTGFGGWVGRWISVPFVEQLDLVGVLDLLHDTTLYFFFFVHVGCEKATSIRSEIARS